MGDNGNWLSAEAAERGLHLSSDYRGGRIAHEATAGHRKHEGCHSYKQRCLSDNFDPA